MPKLYTHREVTKVKELYRSGMTSYAIYKLTKVPYSTVKSWVKGWKVG